MNLLGRDGQLVPGVPTSTAHDDQIVSGDRKRTGPPLCSVRLACAWKPLLTPRLENRKDGVVFPRYDVKLQLLPSPGMQDEVSPFTACDTPFKNG